MRAEDVRCGSDGRTAYVARSAIAGSVRAARRAGSHAAAIAVATSRTMAAAYGARSSGRDFGCERPEEATCTPQPVRPSVVPTSTGRIVTRRMRRRMSRADAPSARRTPISNPALRGFEASDGVQADQGEHGGDRGQATEERVECTVG